MSKIIQKPRECRNAHCGAMCCPIQAEEMQTIWGGNPNKCPYYERRDDLYLTNAIPIPEGATNGDMIRIMFPKIEIYTDVINEIVDVEICEDSSELRCSVDWWNAPYKGVEECKRY